VKTLWISYSWKDNSEGDVDFLAQQIAKAGVSVKLDRYVLQAGKRLWSQIEEHICNADECDAWCVYLTQNSLTSEAVLEEIGFAIDRALGSRGGAFPIIGINPGDVDRNIIPASLRSRLYVNLVDEDWLERVVASVENRQPNITKQNILPIFIKETIVENKNVIEFRPRAGRWCPAFIAVPEAEYEAVSAIMQGPSGLASLDGLISSSDFSYEDNNGRWSGKFVFHNITPINSLYLGLSKKVSSVIFGSVKDDKLDEAYQFAPTLP
jgi:hypothetical protein